MSRARLDPISLWPSEALMEQLKDQFTIVIVTHNMQQAARVSERTAFFNITARDSRVTLWRWISPKKCSRTQEKATSDYVTEGLAEE